MQQPESLPSEWRQRATELRTWAAAESAACALERAADELEQSLQRRSEETLNLKEAAGVSGYTADHLSRLIRGGKLNNAGRPRAPRIRRSDIPQKPSRVAPAVTSTYDPIADARSLLSRRGGR
jgi:hypothetical protein